MKQNDKKNKQALLQGLKLLAGNKAIIWHKCVRKREKTYTPLGVYMYICIKHP